MDEQLYKSWWPLHLKKARGEPLSPEERKVYEFGLRLMEQEDKLVHPDPRLDQAKGELDRLAAECAGLQNQRSQLDEKIRALESLLKEKEILAAKE